MPNTNNVFGAVLLIVLFWSICSAQNPNCCVSSACNNGAFNWLEESVAAGSSRKAVIAHNQDKITIGCIGGEIWDHFSGHPKFSLILNTSSTSQTWDITTRLNESDLTFQASQKTDWALTFLNKNGIWNADFNLTIPGCQPINLGDNGISYCDQK